MHQANKLATALNFRCIYVNEVNMRRISNLLKHNLSFAERTCPPTSKSRNIAR